MSITQKYSPSHIVSVRRSIAVLFALAIALSMDSSRLQAGTFRYELPELLGELRYDIEKTSLVDVSIATPFGLTGVSKATFIIEGSITRGKARGDGVIFEATEFELEPAFAVGYEFPNSGFGTLPLLQPSSFRIVETFNGPFYSVTPLPGPGVSTPPFSFSVTASVGPAITTMYPDRIDSQTDPIDLPVGFVVETPIIANVTEAYVVLEGSSVIPEPNSCTLVALGILTLLLSNQARYASRWV